MSERQRHVRKVACYNYVVIPKLKIEQRIGAPNTVMFAKSGTK